MDTKLLEDCLADHPGAWEAFVAHFEPYLAEACRRVLRRSGRPSGPQEIRDAVQEVFVCLLERDRRVLRAYQGVSTLGGYLASVAAYCILRGRGRDPGAPETAEAADPAPGPPGLLEAREGVEALRREMGRLPPRDALALSLQSRGASLGEVALALGISSDAAAQIVSRARALLRRRLGES